MGLSSAMVEVEPQALLYVLMDPPPGAEDAFNAWYDQHAPARLAMPGILSARRYRRAAFPVGPRYLALYDLEDRSTLRSPAYLRLRREESVRDREMMVSIPLVERRVYRALDPGQPWTAARSADHPPFLILLGMD